MDVGKRLKQLREWFGITQYRLWKASGINQSHISTVEAGKSDISATTLTKLCEGLGITMAQFFDESYPKDMPRSTPAEIGKNIRSARRAAGMSQPELATASGINKTVITLWESGRTWPSEDDLKRLASAMNTTPEELAPYGLPSLAEARSTLQELNIMFRSNRDLTEQDLKEIMSFVEFTRMKRAKESEQKPR